MSNPIENGQVARILYFAVREGKAIDDIPGLVKRVIKGEMWKNLLIKETGEVVNFKTFIEFVTTSPPEGLGTDIDTLWQLCHKDIEAQDLIDEATKEKHGGDRKSNDYKIKFDNIQLDNVINAPTGTSRQAGLRRLSKSRPDLHNRVLAHEISVNAAMVEAGFRPKTITVPLKVNQLASAIKKHLDEAEIEELIELLNE